MKKSQIVLLGVGLLMLAASGHAVNFTRDSGDTAWSNLDQWNSYNGSNYVDATTFPSSGDTILLNAGRILTVDTNASIHTMVAPNATSDAIVEFVSGGDLTANSFRVWYLYLRYPDLREVKVSPDLEHQPGFLTRN